jgi:hypothetical protein
MSSNDLDTYKKQNHNANVSNTNISNTNILNANVLNANVLNANVCIESLEINNIKRETYYKMKFIMNSLEKNWAIKKRKNIFYLKNLEDSSTEIITEDYLNKKLINKIYNRNDNRNDNSNIKKDEHLGKTKNDDKVTVIKKKEDIIPLKEGIHKLKTLIDNGKLNINLEQKNDIYLMIFLMNTLENGWSIRKNADNYIFRKKYEKQKEVYSDEYLVNFLKSNMNNII